jgi:hypothetical protein
VAELQLRQKVSVNLVGLHVAEVEFGGSTIANGIVEEIDETTKEITVRLNISFSGRQFLIVSPTRVNAV